MNMKLAPQTKIHISSSMPNFYLKYDSKNLLLSGSIIYSYLHIGRFKSSTAFSNFPFTKNNCTLDITVFVYDHEQYHSSVVKKCKVCNSYFWTVYLVHLDMSFSNSKIIMLLRRK